MEQIHEEMSIILAGENEVNIDTLVTTLSCTANLLKKSTQYFSESDYQKFVIKDVRKGSFIVDLVAVAINNPTLLKNTGTAIAMFKTFLDIKQHLSGSEPKEIIENQNNVTITGDNNTVVVFDKLAFDAYTDNQDIDDKITKMMKTLSKDECVSGFEIETVTEGEKRKEVYHPNFMSKSIDVSKLTNRIESQVVRQNIKVSKIDFSGDSKWQVYVGSDLVYVKINDEEFRENIESFSFTKGTVLDVDLEIRYHVDRAGIPISGKKTEYIVQYVHDVMNNFVEQLKTDI